LNSAWNESMRGRFQVFAQFPAVSSIIFLLNAATY
jgi:hypothetical protein